MQKSSNRTENCAVRNEDKWYRHALPKSRCDEVVFRDLPCRVAPTTVRTREEADESFALGVGHHHTRHRGEQRCVVPARSGPRGWSEGDEDDERATFTRIDYIKKAQRITLSGALNLHMECMLSELGGCAMFPIIHTHACGDERCAPACTCMHVVMTRTPLGRPCRGLDAPSLAGCRQ